MDVAEDFTMGIWVETVATVEVGAVEFTGVVGVGGCMYGLGNYPHLIFSLVTDLGFWGFSGHGVIILWRCTDAWLWLGPGSGTKLTL